MSEEFYTVQILQNISIFDNYFKNLKFSILGNFSMHISVQ